MNQKKPFQSITEAKTHLKLPYLQKPDKPKTTLNDQKPSHVPNFNLRISNIKMPFYNPESDKNLKSFFQKPSNKKFLERINERTISKNKNHQKQTNGSQPEKLFGKQKDNSIRSRHENLSQNVSRKRISTISSQDFLTYLENVRMRILSSASTNGVKNIIKSPDI